jgi:Tfp pilus assembly protein PilF
VTEDNEGLGILAMRAGDTVQARKYMEEARRGGTKNVSALTSYSALVKDPETAMSILKEALTADPKYAPAHWALGERIADPRRRLAEWKQAVKLAPRKYDWWAQYAQLCLDQKQYAEAGRAWVAAAQAAPDVETRAQYLSRRGQIDELRREDEAAERRREAAAAAADMDRLKAQAKKELADLEARANANPLSQDGGVKTVDWDDVNGSETMTGILMRVECAGRQLRLDVKDETGKTQRLLVPDPSLVEMTGTDPTVACGPQKPRPVRISYKPNKEKSAVSGEATRIEFR